MDGEKSRQQDQARSGRRDPGATRHGRPHEVVHHHERAAFGTMPASSETGGTNVIPAGDDDDVIEDHVPDNDGPRDPQRPGEANRGPRLHTSIIARGTRSLG